MFFMIVLALIGLAVLLALAALAIANLLSDTDANRPTDPVDEAMDSVTQLQANAWTAIRELRDLEKK